MVYESIPRGTQPKPLSLVIRILAFEVFKASAMCALAGAIYGLLWRSPGSDLGWSALVAGAACGGVGIITGTLAILCSDRLVNEIRQLKSRDRSQDQEPAAGGHVLVPHVSEAVSAARILSQRFPV